MVRDTTRTQTERLLAAPPDTPVRIHSYQAEEAYAEALRTGILHGHDDHAQYPTAYAWMRESMTRLPGFSGKLPVWGWLRRPDGRPKPLGLMQGDMAGTVRITAIVPRGRMLISDLDLWHSVLNEHPVHLTTAESDAHETRWPVRPRDGHPDLDRYEAEMRATWPRVFDPLAPADHDFWGDRSAMPLQACIDGIRMDEVVAVRVYGHATHMRKDPRDGR